MDLEVKIFYLENIGSIKIFYLEIKILNFWMILGLDKLEMLLILEEEELVINSLEVLFPPIFPPIFPIKII